MSIRLYSSTLFGATTGDSKSSSFDELLKEYMDERVNEEHYSTLSDYIRALVREDQKRYAEERLEKLLLEGLESGRGAALGSKEWKQFKKRVLSRAKGRKPRA